VDNNPPNLDWSPSRGASGFAVDVLNEAARRAGIRLEWVYCPNGSRKPLTDGQIDFWPVGYYRPGEYPGLHQTRPWSQDQHAFVWDRDRYAEEPATWDGRGVGVADRIASKSTAARLFPRVRLVPARTRREVMGKMCAGAADVAFLDMRAVEAALLDRPGDCAGKRLQVKPLPELTDPMSLFTRQELGPLAEVLRGRIDDMVNDGTLLSYAERWFSFSSTDVRQALRLRGNTVQIRLLAAVCVTMGLAIGLLVWLIWKLRAARATADRARQLQAEFLANVSHEIRTPMNGVMGTAELMLDTVDDPEIRQQVEIIRESAQGQLELLNQILDQSKIDSGVLLLEMTPFSLSRLMDQVEKTFQPAARNKGLWLRLNVAPQVPALVLGDGLRIRQVVTNLVNNALKFTTDGGVEIAVDAEIEAGVAKVSVSVTDTGIGIPGHLLGTVFERFRQVDASTTRRYGGTGLGLSISRHLVRLMGGDLTVDSEPGRGSVFRFVVPLALAREPQRETLAAPGRALVLKGLSVLVVEDNAVNQRVAQALLERLGADVELAANGVEAVEKCRMRYFDVVLMDCHMPVMDGYQATAEIRKLDGDIQRVPIVALTAGVSGEERKKALQSGMDGFLSKPVSREELSSTLAALPRRESPAA
jgi:signal transduction histidine kinase/ActR/RegA family two-component response regulator